MLKVFQTTINFRIQLKLVNFFEFVGGFRNNCFPLDLKTTIRPLRIASSLLYLLMNLTQAQIKEQELKLLEINGFSLAEYCDSNNSSKIFKDLPTQTCKQQLERLKVIKIQSSGVSSNANLKAIANILLKTIYDNETKQDLLDFLKSSLYCSNIDLTKVKHHPLQLTNQQMKKLVVQFFYSLNYSRFQDKVDQKLGKYPIIMEILVLYIRTILKQLGLNNAENYLFRLPTEDVLRIITQYFDLNCREQGNLYLFFEDRMFILENQHNQILFGQYIQNQTQKRTQREDFRFEQIQELEDNAENEWSKQGTLGFNRSLELRGMVSQSTIFQQEAATPFFVLDQDSCTSFQSSRQPSLVGDYESQKFSLLKNQKDVSLLKQMDRMTGSQQMGLGGNSAMKKITLQKQLKNQRIPQEEQRFNNRYGFGLTLESPITLDSPHTLQIPSDQNFGLYEQRSSKIKQMKKSKSQKRSKTMPAEHHTDDDIQKQQVYSLFQQKYQEVYSNISQNDFVALKKECDCMVVKKQKLKLNSQLYQINALYNRKFPDFSKKQIPFQETPSATSIFNKNNLVFTRGKSISGLQKEIKQKVKKGNLAFKLQQSGRITPNVFNDQSFSSYSVKGTANPESDSISRRQFSPLSNLERPLSPFGGSKSITTISSPKITFNYKNPLKSSICMKRIFLKGQQKR